MPKQTWILDSVPGRADPSVHGRPAHGVVVAQAIPVQGI